MCAGLGYYLMGYTVINIGTDTTSTPYMVPGIALIAAAFGPSREGRNSAIVVRRFCDPLRGLQGRSVSNTVSNAGEFVHAMANVSGQEVLRFGEI